MMDIRVLVGRWSRRDWLAVLVIALTAALLVGATLVVVAAGTQTATLADEFDANASVSSHASVVDARDAAGPDAIVLPMATAIGPDGHRHRVVGIPETAPQGVDLPAQPDETVGPGPDIDQWRLEGANGSVTETVAPTRTASGILPPDWLRTNPDTLDAIGPTGALVLTPIEDGDAAEGTPLVSALAFFVDGTDDVLEIVWTGIAAAGVIVAVTLSSVVRLTIRARQQAIHVLRATGAPPRRIRAALAARAGLLAATGGVLGYAIGVIVVNTAVTIAVAAGLPTTLAVQVTKPVALFVGALLVVLTGLGTITGYVTARGATAGPPARSGAQPGRQVSTWRAAGARLVPGRVRRRLVPTVLPVQTILPTSATLATFAVVVLLVASLGTVGASLSAGGETITEPGASHPLSSQIPTSYAAGIEDDELAASPEIVLLASIDSQSYLARGVDYEAFATVTDARLVDGTSPKTDREAVIGVKLAETLDIEPGDELVIGGTTEAAVTQVTVVGMYETTELEDHQLLVSLPTARHLTSVEPGHVNLIRTNVSDRSSLGGTESPTVVDIDAPARVHANESLTAEVTVWNPTAEPIAYSLSTTLGGSQTTESVSLDADEQRTVTIELETPPAGEYTLDIGGIEQSVTVTETPSLEFVALPDVAPPSEPVRVQVVESTGNPVTNARVSLANRTAETDTDGIAWIDTPATDGTHYVRAQTADQELNRSLRVADGEAPAAVVDVTLSPRSPTMFTQPTLAVQLTNPWQRSLETPVSIDGAGTDHRETVSLEPGESTTVTNTLSHQPPGSYTVDVTAGDRATSYEYQVAGDERLTSALAAGGYYGGGGGGLGTAIEYAIGNLHVLLGTLVGLAAVTVVGATSAVLARAVSTRRRTLAIYRATGASPWRLLARIIGDAARIGLVASGGGFLVALVALEALAWSGQLTAFGIALDPRPTATVAGGVLGGGIALTCIAALVATVPMLRNPPATLLAGSRATPPSRHADEGSTATAPRRDADPSPSVPEEP